MNALILVFVVVVAALIWGAVVRGRNKPKAVEVPQPPSAPNVGSPDVVPVDVEAAKAAAEAAWKAQQK